MSLRPLVASLLLLSACAGPQASAPAPVPPVEAAPRPAAARPADDPRARLIWYVFFQEIHALTIYPQPGLIRSEAGNQPTPGFEGRSAYFSVFSLYHERETEFAEALHGATSLDDLLARLRAMPGVRVEEDVNPTFASEP